MLVKIQDIGGELIKDNDTYTLKDNTLLNNLTKKLLIVKISLKFPLNFLYTIKIIGCN